MYVEQQACVVGVEGRHDVYVQEGCKVRLRVGGRGGKRNECNVGWLGAVEWGVGESEGVSVNVHVLVG